MEVKAIRTDANYRHYSDAHTQRLQFVRHCRSLDMSLDEIRAKTEADYVVSPDCHAMKLPGSAQ